MELQQFYYDNKIVKKFIYATIVWGIVGMVIGLLLAFLFSKNRKAINWKTVGIGLVFQLIIAVGVLKVDFIKTEGNNTIFLLISQLYPTLK